MSQGKSYRLVIFDWEGTLGRDTAGQALSAIAQEAQNMSLGIVDMHAARNCISSGLPHAITTLFPNLLLYQREKLLNAVHTALATKHADDYLMPGARQCVMQLFTAGVCLAIATNKGQASLQRVLHASGLDVYFSVFRSASQVPAKPCPQMLTELMAIFGVNVNESVMIGDSVVDMEMASAIGMDVIGMDFYHVMSEELRNAGALSVFDNYPLLLNALGISN